MKTIQMILLVMIIIATGKTQISAQTDKTKDGVYSKCDEMPEYPGGVDALMAEIAANVKYPEEAKAKGIQGKVFVSFVIDELGKVTDAKIARGVEPSLDKESLRVVNELKTWKPGKDKGEVVKVGLTIPINYALDSKNLKKE